MILFTLTIALVIEMCDVIMYISANVTLTIANKEKIMLTAAVMGRKTVLPSQSVTLKVFTSSQLSKTTPFRTSHI
jgi:hypothetical protein